MKMKVELLADCDAKVLQTRINDFIKEKKVIDIKFNSVFIPMSTENGTLTNATLNDRVLIMYEEE